MIAALLLAATLPSITLARRVPTTDGRPNVLIEIKNGALGDILESLPRNGTLSRFTPLDSDSCFLAGESRTVPFGSYICDVPVDTISLWDHRLARGDWRSPWTNEVNIGCEFIAMHPPPGESGGAFDCPCGILKSPTGCDDSERGINPPPTETVDFLARSHFLRHIIDPESIELREATDKTKPGKKP